jgi:hypothetical protein
MNFFPVTNTKGLRSLSLSLSLHNEVFKLKNVRFPPYLNTVVTCSCPSSFLAYFLDPFSSLNIRQTPSNKISMDSKDPSSPPSWMRREVLCARGVGPGFERGMRTKEGGVGHQSRK